MSRQKFTTSWPCRPRELSPAHDVFLQPPRQRQVHDSVLPTNITSAHQCWQNAPEEIRETERLSLLNVGESDSSDCFNYRAAQEILRPMV